jgi:transposase
MVLMLPKYHREKMLIKSMYNNGIKIPMMAKVFNCSARTIRKMIRKMTFQGYDIRPLPTWYVELEKKNRKS